ncbi:hemagglutinin repeat-containing protein [Psychrobacter sp. BF1]|uniref:hemagglutinin repeat-containing protein n=1 Tax=Psychrobacter sp. BF1 TaxID=2821147 RepID=UPI001C4DE4C2|nr:hemagglutinin repeat-containing protein [Psychrobacter sp. BF1]
MSIAGTLKAKAVAKQASDSLQGASSFGNTRIQATVGTQKSQSNSSSDTEVNHASNITTNNLALIATGGGTDSNININGSNLNVTNDALFQADNNLNINAVAQNSNTRSDNSSSSAAIGGYASTGSGVGITASASKGYANSDSVTYADSQVNVGGTTTFNIGNDVNIKGGVINTNKAQGQILGDVNIESLQDTATYDSNQKNIGFTADIALEGAGSSLSLNGGKTNINADYKGVGQQSGIFTGDGGFDLTVDGKTDLIGGAITTTDAALAAGLNNYVSKGGITTRDIENTSSHKGSAIQVGISLGMTNNKPQGNTNGLGYGTDSDSDSSTTRAGITGIAGNSGITTDNREEYAGALENVFDETRVNEELGAQVEITQAFDQERRKIKTELNKKEKGLREEAEEQDQLGNTVDRDNLLLQADKVQKQGLLFDAVSGAIYGPNTNGVTGYVAKAASPFITSQIGTYFKANEAINSIDGGDRSEQGSAAHILAQGILGAAISYATGNDALTGGISAGSGEATAPLLSKFLYGSSDPPPMSR